jgi:phytoene synthase
MNAAATPQNLTNSGITNFYYSFLFLPREKRQAIEAVYAFARRGDDIVDSDLSLQDAKRELAIYREDLDLCYAGLVPGRLPGSARIADDAGLGALQEAIRRFNIPRQYF